MHQALIIYIILQSLFFSSVLILGKKRENKSLTYYFLYLCVFHVFFMLTNDEFSINLADSEPTRITYEFIALCNTAVVFMFLYTILKKKIPKPLYLLWLLPIIHISIDLSFKTFDHEFYNAGFYNNWYLNFPFYTKILFPVLLLWQLKKIEQEMKEKEETDLKPNRFSTLHLGKYFVLFHLALSVSMSFYLFLTLTNGRWYTVDSSILYYSPYCYNMIHGLCIILFLLVFGYLALQNPSILNPSAATLYREPQFVQVKLPELPVEEKPKSGTGFSEEQTTDYIHVLSKLLEAEKMYLDPELSLIKLAKSAAIPSRQLSKFIQQTFQKNFKEYVNGFRIAHAQQLLVNDHTANYTMYSIAFDSGFNAESSFYKIFKDQTGMTPKQYQDKFKNAS